MAPLAGLLDFQQPFFPSTLPQMMLQSMWHHSPFKDFSLTTLLHVSLGKALLPLSPFAGNPNPSLCDQRYHLCGDIRLDNRKMLLQELEENASRHHEISDEELVLKAYHRWGASCLQKLLGDFAFAIWDASRKELFCARDHMGIKPLYYWRGRHRFAFASEIKGLLSISWLPKEIEEEKIADYLLLSLQDKELTFYKDIFRLPPAHFMIVSPSRFRMHRYWSLSPTQEIHFPKEEDYIEAFRERFTESVRCRMQTQVPVGSHLSGGLDSSAVACTMRDLLKQEGSALPTFSIVYPDIPESDERAFIDTILEGGGFCPHFVRGDNLSPMANWDKVSHHIEEPSGIANIFLIWELYRSAQEQGVQVLLNGIDGDIAVSNGFAFLTELACQEDWGTFAKESQSISEYLSFYNYSQEKLFYRYAGPYLRQMGAQRMWVKLLRNLWTLRREMPIPVKELLYRYVARPLIPEAFATWRRRKLNPLTTDLGIPGTLIAFASRFPRIQALQERWKDTRWTEREDHFLGLNSGLLPVAVELDARLASAFGIESRYPFFDRRLVEFCLALPPRLKLKKGWSRAILREAMEGVLPPSIQWRKDKSHLGFGFHKGLLAFEKERLSQLFVPPMKVSPYLHQERIQEVFQHFVKGQRSQDAYLVWLVALLELWLQKFAQQ